MQPTETAIDQLRTAETSAIESMQAERDNAPAIYAELLDPDRAPESGDSDRLREVMATLGLTLVEVERHAEARRLAGDLAEIEERIAKLDAERDDAMRELYDAQDHFVNIQREWTEKRDAMRLRNKGLEMSADALMRERERFLDQRRIHPLAFGQGATDAG